MDLNEFRSFILDSGLDVWTWIDMAISVASADHESELKKRRDGIVQRLYAPVFARCLNCGLQLSCGGTKCKGRGSEDCETHNQQKLEVGCGEKMSGDEEQEEDGDDVEERKILEIKILLDDENQSERSLIELLQRLVDMNTTFKALKETDIGRHVIRFRKHSSNEVRRLVKILVRKWKDTVDEWVRLNAPKEDSTEFNVQFSHQVMKSHSMKPMTRAFTMAWKHKTSVSCCLTPPKAKLEHNQMESDKLGSAKKRLPHQNYEETQHAKKQRTSKVINFHNITNNGSSVPIMKYIVHGDDGRRELKRSGILG
ncbi:putative mediator of RNA polymerase II transcription subunitc [Sesamum angolense]|uniref:Mediator of RNA polymerase II transcription subunitc n=1 Tax=Sesamum angolense TaxID=2727404 RepID=A0AAE1WCZ5_9LAMI|nr:putative mediator of RNA polymerase II transcription subunitc [Sesamum angolense]